MSTSNLVRWGGLALIVGAALILAGDIVESTVFGDQPFSEAVTQPAYVPVQFLFLLGALFVMLGVVGLYARQADRAGALGVIAFVVAVAGILLISGAIWASAFVAPSLASAAPQFLDTEEPGGSVGLGFILSFTLGSLGLVLLGFSSVVSKALPAWAGWALAIGTLVSFVLGILEIVVVGDVVFAAGLVAVGYALWSEKSVTPTTPSM